MSVTLSLWEKAPLVFINGNLPDPVRETLDDELSYEVPDAEYTTAYKNHEWDGYQRLLNRTSDGTWYFPVGLLDRARGVLDAHGVGYDVEGLTFPGRGNLDLSWESDIELRDYQQQAVDDALRHGRGVVVLPTGAGKTIIGLYLVADLDHTAMVVCDRREIADQWVEGFEEHLGVDAARYYGGERENGDIQVALYQSVYEDGDIRDDVRLDHEVGIYDECHKVGADSFWQVARSMQASYRFGFSATPEREDNATLRVIGGTGEFIADLSAERLIEMGYLAEPEWDLRESARAGGDYETWNEEYEGEIVENHRRNQQIASAVADYPKPCYVHVERILHGELLEAIIGEELPDGESVKFVSADSSDREEAIASFADGDLDVLVSTLLGEGFNLPEMASLVMAGGLKTSVGAIQKVGRALRPETDSAVVLDFHDSGRWVRQHSEERMRTYDEYYGKFGPFSGA